MPENKLRRGDIVFVREISRSYAATTLAQATYETYRVGIVTRATRDGLARCVALWEGGYDSEVGRNMAVYFIREEMRPAARALFARQKPSDFYNSKEELRAALESVQATIGA